MSKVKDMSLAKEGIRKIEWVQRHMPVLEHIKKEYEEAGWLVDLEFTVPYNVNTKQVALMTFELDMQ